ncbi:xanthine dehydrogenase family protein molybdopterin-binding subunit [Sphingomonas nostoxanthinifaciens]|uniref:xanthine dehydrogenase family protein molybdopterin-binding subunit n=1 Tax=Sphingomonas nostoxanthinifaciens TaxID=2872652 RepID=UPI001CC1F431|nr:molybdopterin cofactor-binding domain-containing protein [Sphingomonas nostoxanthinifaciens]UAK24133.1 molybdopterin-dependent oxidoreductase [Sphingomonas nostoxanthinifaciens]
MAPADANRTTLSRRTLLIGGGAGVGLVLAWELWPRDYRPNLAVDPGETVMGAFLKIAETGRVTVVVPQAEMGQGVWTALPQALADELGADWRQIAVEPAPLGPLYANRLIAGEMAEDALPHMLAGVGRWAAQNWATRNALMITAGSTSIRAFEQPFREAGAMARALLCMTAGKRIGADWRACDTEAGFVVRGQDRFRFGALAAEAAGFAPPATPPLRRPGEGGISGKAMPRLDLPAKVDGSTRFAGDVRLPGMLHASVRHGPLGDTGPAALDLAAADRVPGVVGIVRSDGFVAALAENWWAADRALDALHPRFATRGALPNSVSVAHALDAALATGGTTFAKQGDAATALAGAGVIEADYAVPFSAHATIEPLVATARLTGDRLELWVPTQAQGLTRAAVARATGIGEHRIIVYPMQVGGGFGRKIENDAAIEAAILAVRSGKPVQLMWSRREEMLHGRHGPPARARMRARLGGQGRIAAWQAVIAAPATAAELGRRLIPALPHGGGPERAAIDGAVPPYAIPVLAIAHALADVGIPTGLWRSAAHASTAFFVECFADELAAAAGMDALSFRMGLLGAQPRLARCLAQATASGGWTGEARSGQGVAVHSAFGSHIALYCEARIEGGAIKVTQLTAVVDCGRVINPDIVRQQIESGLVWGMAAALGDGVTYAQGLAEQTGFADLRLPLLKDMPEIAVELIASAEAPGGVAELAVPVTPPAIANAIFSATGKRLRALPLAI